MQEKSAVDRAKIRCADCACLVDKDGRWWCDEWDCECENITHCAEWTDSRGNLTNPEWLALPNKPETEAIV